MLYRLVDKPNDVIVVLSDGGFNSAMVLFNLVNDKETRFRRYYVMNIQTNPSVKKYIKKQIAYCRAMATGIDIRYFGISEVPEEDKELSIKELIEKYAEPAILDFFDQHFIFGSDIQIYVGFDKTSYEEIEFKDEKLKGIVHYPLKDMEEDYAIDQLMQHHHGLFRMCTTCDNATEEKQWCGDDQCYDCLYVKHICSRYNYFKINSMVAYWIREDMENWFDLKLPASQQEIYELQTSDVGCNCAECNGDSEDSFILVHTDKHKRVIYGKRDALRDMFNDMVYNDLDENDTERM